MSFFEKYLSFLVLLCIVVGISIGNIFSGVTRWLSQMEFFHVNIVIAFFIWILVIPMFANINITSLWNIKKHYKGMIITLVVNWLIKPFSMFLIGSFFLHIFSGFFPESEKGGYLAGLILLAAAPCTAMVFVWSRLVKGDPAFTLTQVALNDILMIFLFAPIVALLLGVSSISIPSSTLVISVFVYIIFPFAIGQYIRHSLQKRNQNIMDFMARTQKYSEASLLIILVCIFSFQGKVILHKPLTVLLLAVPIIIQTLLTAGIALVLNLLWKEKMSITGPSVLISGSNFFELAVASAVSLFGINSGAVLATVVGVLVEVPLMLFVVGVLNHLKNKILIRPPRF